MHFTYTNTDAMYCHPPKPHYIKFLEHLELQFRVESKPVVALLFILIVIGVLYIFLLPFTVSLKQTAKMIFLFHITNGRR